MRKWLVIHIDSQDDTADLKYAYEEIDCDVLYNARASEIRKSLPNYDNVLIMGHGSNMGLFSEKWDGYAVDSTMVAELRKKNVIGIWCYASEFARRYRLNGFFTSMFISNKYEALGHGYPAENPEIFEETKLFVNRVNELIRTDIPLSEYVDILQSKADYNKGFVKFNYEALEYFENDR